MRHAALDAGLAGWPRQHHRRARAGLWIGVLLAHGLALLGWQSGLQHGLSAAPAPVARSLTWLQILPAESARLDPSAATRTLANSAPREARLLTPPRTPVLPVTRASKPDLSRTAEGLSGPSRPAPGPGPDATPGATDGLHWIAAPEPPASAPRERLLDSAATRQAIREAARQPLLSERAQQATDIAPVTQAERLAAAAAAAGKGDCMKGQYAGGGMGILSLPFLAVAAATGGCAK